MASEKDATCANDPNFAIICAFFQKFSVILNVPQPDIKLLQSWLENTDEVPSGLKELHIKLLRKLRKTVHNNAWETALVKFCHTYSQQDAWEIERFGYKKSSLKVKLRILKEILECQFERNGKFRSGISSLSAADLREEPIGRDKLGHAYWLTQDLQCNLRIYQEHLDEEIWQVVASNREELVALINRLKGNEVVLPSLVGVVDEDSSSNSCPVAIVKPPPPEEKDESQEEKTQEHVEEKVPNIKIKLDSCTIERSEDKNDVVKNEKIDTKLVASGESAGENEVENEATRDDCVGEGEERGDVEEPNKTKESKTRIVEKVTEQTVAKNGIVGSSTEKKLKSIVISPGKGTVASDDRGKKRLLEISDVKEKISENTAKKARPTLLDVNRKKNVSKYEQLNTEEECDEECQDEEGEEEESEDEEEEEEEDEEEGEEEEGEEEGEDEEDGGEEKEAKKDLKKIEHQENKVIDQEPEVSEAIEEDVQVVKGEGSGMECDASFLTLTDVGCERFEIIGEEIEEETLYVFGEGLGFECLVGNAKEETENKSLLYFRQPGCIKLSHINKKDDILLNDRPKESDDKGMHVENELRNGDKNETDDNLKAAHKSLDSEVQEKAEDLSNSNKCVTMTTIETSQDSSINLDKGHKDISVEDNSIENIPANENNDSEPVEIVSSPEESEKNSGAVIEISEVSEDAKESKCLNDDENDISQSTCGTLDEGRSGATRKRRLSEDKCQKFIVSSDSDSDCNSEGAEVDPDESQIGGKRFKARPKSTNADVRKKVEEQRNNEKGTSSSDEETSKKESEEQLKVVTTSNTIENNQLLQNEETCEGNTQVSVSLDTSIDDMKNSPVLIETEEFKKVTDELIEEFSSAPVSGGRAWRGRRGRRRGRIGKTFVGSRLGQLNSDEPLDAEIQDPALKTSDEDKSKTVDVKNDEERDGKSEKLTIKSEKSQDEGEEEGEIILQIEVKPSSPKKKSRRAKEIDVTNIIDVDADAAPVRQSRRIAQLKMKEEAERRRLEEIALKKMKADLNKKKREEKKCQVEEEEEAVIPSDNNSDSDAETKKKLEKKKKGKKKGGWSSGSDEEEEEEEYEYEHETEVGSPLFRSDHEFSPESDIGDESQAVPLKRARTAKKESDGSDVENEGWCEKCGKRDHPEWILLCDRCDKGYHCSCLIPVLFIIPEGDWYCPPCEQQQLIESLEQHLKIYDEKVRKKELEDKLRQESLEMAKRQAALDAAAAQEAQHAKRKEGGTKKRSSTKGRRDEDDDDDESDDDDDDEDDVDSTAVNSSASSSPSRSSSSTSSSATDSDDEPIYKLRKRRQVNLDYRFNEYDDLINSAIKKEMDEVAGAGNLGRGKDISTIIEADKEEKLRKKQLEAKLESERALKIKVEPVDVKIQESDPVCKQEIEQKEIKQELKDVVEAKEDSGSDFEPLQRKLKVINRVKNRKKNRKLNSLDSSSEEDESDEDFKTSSYETDEDEDEEVSETSESESSLSVYRAKKKKNKRDKKGRPVRRVRERRKRYDDFIVDDSDPSVDSPKMKKKRKVDSDYSESLTEEELSEDVDSEDLCEDSTDSEESDLAWRPGKRRKQKSPVKPKPPSKSKSFSQKKKQKNKRRDVDEGEKSFKGKFSKKKRESDDDDSGDSTRRTRGKRFTYLEDYEDESSEDGIKPGVKRPDTPPEEREEFIRKQEAIKRMLAERNAEAAKAVATPKINPISKPDESLSTVPPSVIRGAKVLDMDYLARKGELESDPETEFDDDLPDDFNPEDMDEEEIAKMMEEEDFAQHQLKLAGEVIRQKKIKESEVDVPKIPKSVGTAATAVMPESPKKRPAMTIMQTLLVNPLVTKSSIANSPSQVIPPSAIPTQSPSTEPLIPTTVLSVQENNSTLSKAGPDIPVNSQTTPTTQAQIMATDNKPQTIDPSKPRGRRKKITPLRDTLQKQQTAAAAAAAQAAAAAAAAASAPSTPTAPTAPSTPTVPCTPTVASAPSAPSAPTAPTPPAIKSASSDSGLPEKVSVITAPSLSIAQPPQLYKPASTPPSVITRLPQPPRPRFADPALAARFYSSPNQLLHRPPIRHGGINLSPHLTLRPSYANGPPPLRSANPPTPVSIGNGIVRHPPPRSPFGSSEQFPGRGPPHPPYRPPLYGAPGYPPAPPSSSQPPAAHHSVPFTNYFAPPIGSAHSTPPPPVPTVRNPSSIIPSVPPSVQPPPVRPLPPPSEMEPIPPVSRPNATALETFNTKSTPPPLQPETDESPYASNLSPEGEEDEPPPPASAPTSEFSGLVSYFSSQQDDLNT